MGIVEGFVEAFPAFDLHKDIVVGQFVEVLSPVEERRLGAIFYVGKGRALERAATADGVMIVTLYWPKMSTWINRCGGRMAPTVYELGVTILGAKQKKPITTLW